MRRYLLYVLPLLTLACSAVVDDELDCAPSILIDEPVRQAVPYQNGETLTFDVSDGSVITTTVLATRSGTDADGRCVEGARFFFDGINANHNLKVFISLYGDYTQPNVRIDFTANTVISTHHLLIKDDGALSANPTFGQLEPEIELNGQTFRDVSVQEHERQSGPVSLRRSYYSVEAGMIGVEFTDGTTILLRE